jgi:hypothetical protein
VLGTTLSSLLTSGPLVTAKSGFVLMGGTDLYLKPVVQSINQVGSLELLSSLAHGVDGCRDLQIFGGRHHSIRPAVSVMFMRDAADVQHLTVPFLCSVESACFSAPAFVAAGCHRDSPCWEAAAMPPCIAIPRVPDCHARGEDSRQRCSSTPGRRKRVRSHRIKARCMGCRSQFRDRPSIVAT